MSLGVGQHGLEILPDTCIFNLAGLICFILGMIVQCVTEIFHMLPVGDLYFTVQ